MENKAIKLPPLELIEDSPCLDGYDDGSNDLKCVWNFRAADTITLVALIYRVPENKFDAHAKINGTVRVLPEETVVNLVEQLPDAHRKLVAEWSRLLETGADMAEIGSVDLAAMSNQGPKI